MFQEGFEIFALYPDDTEAMLDDEGELDTHDGLFGIEKGSVGEVPQEGSSQRRKRNAGKGTKDIEEVRIV